MLCKLKQDEYYSAKCVGNVKTSIKNGGLQFVSEMHYRNVFVYNLMST